MEQNIIRTFCLDGDSYQVIFLYDAMSKKYFGEYPDFEESPRYTASGHPWVTAMQEGCDYSVSRYAEGSHCMDCGSCRFYTQEQKGDLIGICTHPEQQRT